MFNAQPTGTVISRRYTLHSSLITNKTWFVKRIWFSYNYNDKVKKKKRKKKKGYGYHSNKTKVHNSVITVC